MIPDVRGLLQREADRVLAEAGLSHSFPVPLNQSGELVPNPDWTHTVIAMNPSAGTAVEVGTEPEIITQ